MGLRTVIGAGLVALATLAAPVSAASSLQPAGHAQPALPAPASAPISQVTPTATAAKRPFQSRIAGGNRYETAAKSLLLRRRQPHDETLVLVAGDRLHEAVLAQMVNLPVLLVPEQGPIPRLVRDALRAAKPKQVTVYGPEDASFNRRIRELVGSLPTYLAPQSEETLTARSMDAVARDELGWAEDRPAIRRMVVASTAHLGLAALAGEAILVPPTPQVTAADVSVHAHELRWDGPFEILGGPRALPDTQVSRLLELMQVPQRVTREPVGDGDPISTSVALATRRFPRHARKVHLVAADADADALAAMQMATGPIVLVPRCGRLPRSVAKALAGWRPVEVVAIGDEATVCPAMLAQAASVTSPLPGVRAIETAASRSSACAITARREVRCWGWLPLTKGPRFLAEPMTMPGLPADVIDVTPAQEDGYCALTRRGAVWCFGGVKNAYERGTLPIPIQGLESGVTRLWLGWLNHCAQKRDRSLWCWGKKVGGEQWVEGTTYQKAVRVPGGVKALPRGLPRTLNPLPDKHSIDRRGRVRCDDWPYGCVDGAGGPVQSQPEVIGFGV